MTHNGVCAGLDYSAFTSHRSGHDNMWGGGYEKGAEDVHQLHKEVQGGVQPGVDAK